MTEQELLALIDRAEREEWTELDLRGEEITVLPPEIGRLIKLDRLSIGGEKDKELGIQLNLNPLSALPPEIGKLVNLVELDLSGNELQSIPAEIGQLINLLSLNLFHNHLASIPPEVGRLTNLVELNLSVNKLTTVPPEIDQLLNLTIFNLDGNQLTVVPPEITQLVNLTSLYLGSNQLTTIPAEINQLIHLTRLYLHNNQLTGVPPQIGHLVNLTSLSLNANQLITVPPEIGQLINLSKLNLSRNDLTSLPSETGQLVNLTSLSLHSNNLTAVPLELSSLVNLIECDIRWNKLIIMPAGLGNLTHLNRLDIGGNQLTHVPSEIGQLVNLTLLDLSGNQLTAVPPEIGKLINLTSLDLGDNQLRTVPSEIGQLVNLTTLDLASNQLEAVPSEIRYLINLAILNLRNNQLMGVPSEIGQLVNLTLLHLGYNQLTAVPPEIGQLNNLLELILEKNQLSTLPQAITRLHTLERIYLYGNPLPLPPELLREENSFASDPHTVFEAYFQQCTPLHQLKLMLLGEGTVGKTSLAERLLHNQPPSGKGKTVGVEIWPWEVEIEAGDRDRGAEEQRSGGAEGNVSPIRNPHSTIRINLWDFGGQEIYHATHQFFLTHRSLYVLVVDARQDDEANRLAYWLQLIASFGGDSPVLLVVNKIDEARRKLAERELYAQYPNLRGILYTSCTTGEGIGELRHALAQTIATMPHVNDQIPTRWMAVKNKLAGLGKDFISYDKFEELCEAEEISHPATRATLAKLLHDLGSALHFAEENNLAGTHILQPDWVTHGIYNLLNAPDLQTKGVLPLGMVGHILDRTRYPFHKHEFLLEIMEKFELCFRLPEHRTWLIPTLLPPDRPDFAWPAQSQPAFQLHYTILLPSIIGRLMVRLHQHTWQGVRWRDGFVLAREGARAQVRAIRTQNRIAIWLDGDPAQRRSLLTLIRAQLDEIHASFAKLGVEAFVPIPNHAPHVIKYEALVRLAERGDTTYYDPNADANIDVFGLLDALETPIERLELLLHKRLMAGFDLQELKTLVSMDLGLDYDEYPQDKKSAFARELLLDCKRNGRLERLQNALLRQRP